MPNLQWSKNALSAPPCIYPYQLCIGKGPEKTNRASDGSLTNSAIPFLQKQKRQEWRHTQNLHYRNALLIAYFILISHYPFRVQIITIKNKPQYGK